MEKTFVCDISEKDSRDLSDLLDMKNTLESLVRQIAENNDILKEDSHLYKRLLEDYKKNRKDFDRFWYPYYEKYGHLLHKDMELSIDFRENKLFIVPK